MGSKRQNFFVCLILQGFPFSWRPFWEKRDHLHYTYRHIKCPFMNSLSAFQMSTFSEASRTKCVCQKMAIFSQFWPFFGCFYPLTFAKKFQLTWNNQGRYFHRVCKSYRYWVIFAQMVLLQRAVFGQIWKEVWFLLSFHYFYPVTYVNGVQITGNLQRSYIWISFTWYMRIIIIAYFLQLWHSKEQRFF